MSEAGKHIVCLDSNVFSKNLGTYLLNLAREEGVHVYTARWSRQTLEEVRAWRTKIGVKKEAIDHWLDNRVLVEFPTATVEVSDEEIALLTRGNDPKDRHVHIAAAKSGADIIVTGNLRDFTVESLEEALLRFAPNDEALDKGIHALTPDEFLCQLLGEDNSTDRFDKAFKAMFDKIQERLGRTVTLENALKVLIKPGEAPGFVQTYCTMKKSRYQQLIQVLSNVREK